MEKTVETLSYGVSHDLLSSKTQVVMELTIVTRKCVVVREPEPSPTTTREMKSLKMGLT